MGIKLNLGCGQNKLADYVNVDREGSPDVKADLARPGWPFEDGSATEVIASHVMEHIGPGPEEFLAFMRELYRVCAPGALITIAVPHPRHDDFLNDPTHVRPVTPQVLSLFSKANCRKWKQMGAANSPLADYLDVDFEMRELQIVLAEPWKGRFDRGELSAVEINEHVATFNNVAREIRMRLEVIK